ncbi:MAG: glycosyltransferase [Candidatus Adiutrix sp.]|jgi:tetratricopeptide (TPR) repeat protein|nr:glycosyltransferase [Candidatus Adiutrix sp.]
MGSLEKSATLGLAMIMKNEARNLAQSLAPAAAQVDEMVVVDTGSSDGSREMAQSLGAKVLDFQWIDDFSAARNFGLAAATTDFILWLDGDNSVTPEGVAEFRKHLIPGGDLILWATEVVTPQGDRIWQKRVFPNRPEARFEGRVHEQLVHPPHWTAVATEVEILHWGYADSLSARRKGERNLELLLNCRETKNGEFYWLYQTGRTLANLRRHAEAESWLARAAAAKTENRPLWGHALILLSQCQSRLGRHAEAEQTARRLAEAEPGYGPAHYHLGRLLYDAGQWPEAGEKLETALILGTGDNVWGADPASCNFRAAFLLGRVWAAGGRGGPARQAYRMATGFDPKNPEPAFALAEMALAEGREAEARGHLEDVLRLAPEHRRAAGLYAQLKGGHDVRL